jgi:NTP pyrophosphatase (non-canonical NTP hydrolase)
MRLTFAALRAANTARLPTFKNARGEPAHSEPDGSDWCLAQWCNAVTGELGEAANLIKKIERGDISLEEARPALAKEFADVVTYLDILAMRAGVDLGTATLQKFNEVSVRVGSPVRIDICGTRHRILPPTRPAPLANTAGQPATHYVHCNTGNSLFVKEAAFFGQQGGFTEEWGKAWRPVVAASIEDARAQAAVLFGVPLSWIHRGR